MILHDTPYLCSIPRAPPRPRNDTPPPRSSPGADAQELARASARGWDLLQDMEGHCLYLVSGWWCYSFCHNAQIKQFHALAPTADTPAYPPVEDPSTPSYLLGQFPAPPLPSALAASEPRPSAALRSHASRRYLSQSLGGGSACDLTAGRAAWRSSSTATRSRRTGSGGSKRSARARM